MVDTRVIYHSMNTYTNKWKTMNILIITHLDSTAVYLQENHKIIKIKENTFAKSYLWSPCQAHWIEVPLQVRLLQVSHGNDLYFPWDHHKKVMKNIHTFPVDCDMAQLCSSILPLHLSLHTGNDNKIKLNRCAQKQWVKVKLSHFKKNM